MADSLSYGCTILWSRGIHENTIKDKKNPKIGGVVNTGTLLADLDTLYKALPEIGCKGCGECCVSPTCTPTEFLFLLRYVTNTLPKDQLSQALTTPPEIHPDYEGNVRCLFLKENRCMIHPGRTGACRLFGNPALSRLKIPELVECRNDVSIVQGPDDDTFIREWLTKLVALNSRLPFFDTEPFFVRGLNLACWFDIYFDNDLNIDIFEDLRRLMHEVADLSWCKKEYIPRTRIREKIDKISVLTVMLESPDRASIRNLLQSISQDYPLTGSYFYEEAQAYLDAIERFSDDD